MKKKVREIIGSISFISIPAGLISWMFWADGWKVVVCGVIIFTTLVILKLLADELEKKDKRKL